MHEAKHYGFAAVDKISIREEGSSTVNLESYQDYLQQQQIFAIKLL
jgi:hypothetical protein